MPGANYFVFQQMRPPIAIEETGKTPVRTKKAEKVFELGNGNYSDRKGLKITRNQIIQNQTDDGRLLDVEWNKRHHVSPSFFNNKNKSYYRVSHQTPMLIIL